MPEFYAHTLEGEPVARWQKLEEHLQGVANRAECFARDFSADEEARVAGWLHDLGKFRDEFQSYLRKEREGGTDTHHAVYGAALAFENNPPWPCAFAIAGHHAGLHNLHQLQSLVEDPKYNVGSRLPLLRQRFQDAIGEIPRTVALPLSLNRVTPGVLSSIFGWSFPALSTRITLIPAAKLGTLFGWPTLATHFLNV